MGNNKSSQISQFICLKNSEGSIIKTNNVKREMFDLVDSNKSKHFYIATVEVTEVYDYFLNYKRIELKKGGQTVSGIASIFIINKQSPDMYLNVNFTGADHDYVRIYKNKKYMETIHIDDSTDLSNLLTHTLNINYSKCILENVMFDIMISM